MGRSQLCYLDCNVEQVSAIFHGAFSFLVAFFLPSPEVFGQLQDVAVSRVVFLGLGKVDVKETLNQRVLFLPRFLVPWVFGPREGPMFRDVLRQIC